MSISAKIYEEILKEYEEIRASKVKEKDARLLRISEAIPEYPKLESRIASLYVQRSMQRLKGQQGSPEDERMRDDIAMLTERKRILLKAAGYSESDLRIEHVCDKCSDTGYTEDGKICTCFKSRLTEKLYDMSHIRAILEKENFDTFDYGYYPSDEAVDKSGHTALDIAKEAVAKARFFAADIDRSSGNIFLCGSTGVGKTFLANCIAREAIETGHTVVYLSAVRFFEILADITFDRRQQDRENDFLYDCDLLIIDDLGTEMVNSFVQTQLFNCINERMIRDKHTVISSNLAVQELKERYSERVFSRIASDYTIIKLYAKDIRIQKKLRRLN